MFNKRICTLGAHRGVAERQDMTEFWKVHSRQATVEEMMLDSNAQELTEHELPEILSLLPSVAGKDVLELGSGIGSVLHNVCSYFQDNTSTV